MKIWLSVLLLMCIAFGCKRDDLNSAERAMARDWNCVGYIDPHDGIYQDETPVFISHGYEHGYSLAPDHVMWYRYKELNADRFNLDLRVQGTWELSADDSQLILTHPSDSTEVFEIVEIGRKTLTLRGVSGFWAQNGFSYYFVKE